MSQNRRGPNTRNTANIFGPAAPSANLTLPEDLEITLVELVVYLPNSLRNYYVLLRLVQAGLDQQTIANIVNLHRTWVKWPALPNSICKTTSDTMRSGSGIVDWTMKEHKLGNYNYGYQWHQEDLTLNGITLDCEMDPKYNSKMELTNPRLEGIPFANLAIDVDIHPSYSRGDGFMLSRCVQYAAANPTKDYVFPQDFLYLVRKLDDGRVIQPKHLDATLVNRWAKKNYWLVIERPEIEDFSSNVADSVDGEYEIDDEIDLEASVEHGEQNATEPFPPADTGVSGSYSAPTSYSAGYNPHSMHIPTQQFMQGSGNDDMRREAYLLPLSGTVFSSPYPQPLHQQPNLGQHAPDPSFGNTSSSGYDTGNNLAEVWHSNLLHNGMPAHGPTLASEHDLADLPSGYPDRLADDRPRDIEPVFPPPGLLSGEFSEDFDLREPSDLF